MLWRTAALTRETSAGNFERRAKEDCVPECDFALPPCTAWATSKQCIRLLETVSAGTISGCKSSVSEITGNNRASRQTMAIVSCRTLRCESWREAAQRNRHIQSAASVTPSQTRLRIVSIDSRFQAAL